MFEQIQKNLIEVLQVNELCWKQIAIGWDARNVNELSAYFMIIQKKIQDTIHHSKLLCDTNIHCLAKITSIQHEKNEMIKRYDEKIQDLEAKLSSALHTLDHQKTLTSNYSSFITLHGYWKEILHNAVLPGRDKEHRSDFSREEILEIEETCGKLVNWVSIQSYREVFSTGATNPRDDQYAQWTQNMVTQAKRIAEYCADTVAFLKQNDAEKQRLLAALREQKKQRQRLMEKLLDSERVQESLQMNVEELRVIANGHLRKISANESHLMKLFELLVNQKQVLQKYQDSPTAAALSFFPASSVSRSDEQRIPATIRPRHIAPTTQQQQPVTPPQTQRDNSRQHWRPGQTQRQSVEHSLSYSCSPVDQTPSLSARDPELLADLSFSSSFELERHYELTLEKLAHFDIR